MKNVIEELAQEWLDSTGNQIEDTSFLNLRGLGVHILLNDMSCEASYTYQYEVSKFSTKSGNPEILSFGPEYHDLVELEGDGLAEVVNIISGAGVQCWDVQGCEFVVLSDNTVITRLEDNSNSSEAFWPYD